MSFRELRNFTEIMRSLGYPRRISVENFRTPNFALVADVLYWMVQRYDPLCSISDNIETENDRVAFLTSICSIMSTKARVNLKPKSLYAADGRAVKELLKIATVLYAAMKANKSAMRGEEATADLSRLELPPDTSATRAIASEITARGAKLFDLLKDEQELRDSRSKALRFLDAVAGNLDSRAEHDYLERSIRDAIAAMQDNVSSLEKQQEELASDQRSLQSKIKKKQSELERSEKRLRSLQSVRPAFMDEYEKLERDLADEYGVYLQLFMNLDYLEHELDMFNQREKLKVEAANRALQRLQKKLRDEETRIILGEGEVDDDVVARAAAAPSGPSRSRNVVGSMRDASGSDTESTGSDMSGDDSSDDGKVSLGGSETSSADDTDDTGSLLDDDDDGLSDTGSGSVSDDF